MISSIDFAVWLARVKPFCAETVTFCANIAIFDEASVLPLILDVISSNAAAVSSKEAACLLDDLDKLAEAFERTLVFSLSESPVFIIMAKISEVLFPTSLIPLATEPRSPYNPWSLILVSNFDSEYSLNVALILSNVALVLPIIKFNLFFKSSTYGLAAFDFTL